jgi:anti-sigma factor RsiW
MTRTTAWLKEKRDHRWSQRHVHDYLDGELDRAGRARLERHARLCPECGAMLRTFIALLRLLPLLRLEPCSVPPRVLPLTAKTREHERNGAWAGR